MRNWIKAIALCVLPIAATAQDSGLKSLDTSDSGRDWMAVGRLDIKGVGFCTGTLVAPDLVLTAAHCMYNKSTGQLIDPADMEFLAGWRLGRALAYRDVRRVAIHPDYNFQAKISQNSFGCDVALVELWQPIRNISVSPFEIGAAPKRGQKVGVVSYAQNRAEAPSLQQVCSVVNRQSDVVVMSCDVNFGSSGAPVFLFSEPEPQVVSVISAKASMNGESVAIGTTVETAFELLRAELEAGRGIDSSALNGSGGKNVGARFIKP